MPSRKAYQFIQVRVQLKGRGVTNEIDTLHINGKSLKPGLKTLHAFLNYLGTQGFQVVAVQMETEGVLLGVELEIAPQSSRSEPAHPGAPAR